MIVNLRSDTQTLPTTEMRRAMADAELGDDSYGEDPTVARLQELAAQRLGREAALLVLSGTMANLVALLTHCRPGDQVFADAATHVVLNESGGFASVAGVVMTPVASERGHVVPAALRSTIRDPAVQNPRPRLVWLENTHNRAGGTVMSIVQSTEVAGIAAEHGLSVHLDGARLFNAAAALDIPPSDLAQRATSVYIDLTKGLSCPMGSLLVGDADFIEEARFYRQMVGGGMRQAGVMAAAGIVALETLVDRLHEDHALASWLAERVSEVPGFRLDPSGVETNMINVDVMGLGGSEPVTSALAEEGLLVSTRAPSAIRLVTHLQVDRTSATAALEAMRRVSARLMAGRSKAEPESELVR